MDENLAVRDEISDYAGQEAWVNPQTGERFYMVSFPVTLQNPHDPTSSRMARSVNIEVMKGEDIYDLEISWHPEETSLQKNYWKRREQDKDAVPTPKFRGRVGDFGAHLRWLLAGLWWTIVEVQFKWGEGKE